MTCRSVADLHSLHLNSACIFSTKLLFAELFVLLFCKFYRRSWPIRCSRCTLKGFINCSDFYSVGGHNSGENFILFMRLGLKEKMCAQGLELEPYQQKSEDSYLLVLLLKYLCLYKLLFPSSKFISYTETSTILAEQMKPACKLGRYNGYIWKSETMTHSLTDWQG